MTIQTADIEVGLAAALRSFGRSDDPLEHFGTGGSLDRSEMQAGLDAARGLRGKPAPQAAKGDRPSSYAVDLHRSGTLYEVGAERLAADGTRWRRVA